jgi:hypothetical protein
MEQKHATGLPPIAAGWTTAPPENDFSRLSDISTDISQMDGLSAHSYEDPLRHRPRGVREITLG